MSEENVPNSTSDSHFSEGKDADMKTKRTRNIVLIAVIVILVFVIFALAFLLFNKGTADDASDTKPEGGRSVLVNEDNVEEMQAQLMEPIQDGYYQATMNIDWTFDNGTAISSNAYVKNTESNTRMVYFDVILEDGTVVYSSPFIPVGMELDEIALDVDLDAGDYPAICTYHLVDDEQQELSTVSVTVTLHILN